MKAISLKQPWANRVASGEKTVETRTWRTAYRGRLLIVSSLKPPIPPAGQALAIVTLVDCRSMTIDDEEAACCPYEPGRIAWILEDIMRIKPFPVKGQLGIYEVDWEPPDDMVRAHMSDAIAHLTYDDGTDNMACNAKELLDDVYWVAQMKGLPAPLNYAVGVWRTIIYGEGGFPR